MIIELTADKTLERCNTLSILTFGIGIIILFLIGVFFTKNITIFGIASFIILIILFTMGWIQNKLLDNFLLKHNIISINQHKLSFLSMKKDLIIDGKAVTCKVIITLKTIIIENYD